VNATSVLSGDRAGLLRNLTNAPVEKRVTIKDATHFVLFEKNWAASGTCLAGLRKRLARTWTGGPPT
jgi:hypothetical protein